MFHMRNNLLISMNEKSRIDQVGREGSLELSSFLVERSGHMGFTRMHSQMYGGDLNRFSLDSKTNLSRNQKSGFFNSLPNCMDFYCNAILMVSTLGKGDSS